MIAEIVGIDTSSRMLLSTTVPVGAAIIFFQFGVALNAPGLGAAFAFLAGEPKEAPAAFVTCGTGVCVPA
jgi:hypothetical protein